MDIHGLESISWDNGIPTIKLTAYDSFPHGLRVNHLLASGDNNTKTRKNNGRGYLSAGLSLAPHQSAGIGNVCTDASAACIEGCLNGQGLASVFKTIAYARKAKTILWYVERGWFLDTLCHDIAKWASKADAAGMRLCVRLNMFSDIEWEKHNIPQSFPDVMFYDYTKHPKRAGLLLPNYWATFSRSESNHRAVIDNLSAGHNVAVVFYNQGAYVGNRSGLQKLPKTWNGYPVIDGDTTDLRFDDPRGRTRGRVIGLRLKAHSNDSRDRMITSGFAVRAF